MHLHFLHGIVYVPEVQWSRTRTASQQCLCLFIDPLYVPWLYIAFGLLQIIPSVWCETRACPLYDCGATVPAGRGLRTAVIPNPCSTENNSKMLGFTQLLLYILQPRALFSLYLLPPFSRCILRSTYTTYIPALQDSKFNQISTPLKGREEVYSNLIRHVLGYT